MLVAEIYKYESGMRTVETRQYPTRDDLDQRLFWLNLNGQWVGHKIWNCDLNTYETMDSVERARGVVEQKFDKEAYINNKVSDWSKE
tara:strand:- start:1025 stop:1285 length:261 start_codon:yes stop_codon:yes gene_type:complete